MVTPVHSPCILIVEDEPALGRLLIRALEWDGYGVVWVNGEAGLRAAKIWGKSYDLVITNSHGTNSHGPLGVSGPDLLGLIGECFPGIPVLHLDDLCQSHGQRPSGPTLFKPFRLDTLSEAVRELLSGQARAPG